MYSQSSKKFYKALLLALAILSYSSCLFGQVDAITINLDDLKQSATTREIAIPISTKNMQVSNLKIPIVLTSPKGISYTFITIKSNTYIDNPDKKHSINSKGDSGVLNFIVYEGNLKNKQLVRYLHVSFTAFPNGIAAKGITYSKKIALQYMYDN